ncbi:Histone H4 transcription factor, partial [Stegodyphus mimosarum]
MASSLEEKKKCVRFSAEPLSLLCEWEDCGRLEEDIESFISHLGMCHLTNLVESDLHCHWKDCEGFTENLPELRRHILLHAFHTKIKCYGRNLQQRKKMPNCSLSIQSRNIIPELPEPLVCCWENCSEDFECPEHFYRHVDNHAENESKTEKNIAVCLWHDCHRIFADQYKVKEHMRSHTQEKLIACPTCGGMFASRTKFFDHVHRQLAVDDDSEGIYICEYCSRKMNSERLLRDHMRHHVNHYKCPYCDMTCPTPSGIQVHITYRHSESKPYSCQYCDYKCKSENDLRKHLETHRMVPTYKCPVEDCSYTTRSQSCYNAHYRKKHEKKPPAKYSCHLCDKMCTRGNYLTKHLLNHHKFHWPSGHCRFRYHLHEDGFYRLQTVRYESLELSQAMMGDNAENVDDPDDIINSAFENKSEENGSFSSDISVPLCHRSDDHVSSTNPIFNGSVVYCLDSRSDTEFQNRPSVISSSLNGAFIENAELQNRPSVISCSLDFMENTGLQNPPSIITSLGDTFTEDAELQNRPSIISSSLDDTFIDDVEIQNHPSTISSSLSESFVDDPEPHNRPSVISSSSGSLIKDSETSEEKPVLIKIVDTTVGATADSSGQPLLILNYPDQGKDEQYKTVQLITQDSDGRMTFETAEIITEYQSALRVL